MTEEESLKYMLTELDRCALRRIPEIAEELDRLREGLREMELRTIPAQQLDGMPKSYSGTDAMANTLNAVEEQRRRVKLKAAELDRARRRGQKITRKLKASMKMYCQARYIEGRSVEASCAYARISLRTGERYSAIINKE